MLGARGVNYSIVSACASGTHAIGEAAEVIIRGQADAILAGGTESSMIPLILAGFCSMRALVDGRDDPTGASRPFDATRAGFVMAEGAAVLMVEDLEHALARGARIYAEVIGYGASNDALPHRHPPPGVDGRDPDDAATRSRRAGIAAAGRRLHQRPRHLDAVQRLGRDLGDQAGVRRARLSARRVVDQVDGRPPVRRRRRHRGAGHGAHDRPAASSRRPSTTATPTRSATSTTCPTRPARPTSASPSPTRWASAATTAASSSAATTPRRPDRAGGGTGYRTGLGTRFGTRFVCRGGQRQPA